MQHILLFGKPLRAFSTNGCRESATRPRVMNSGTVIMKRIGQSACLLPNSAMIAYGRAPETERIWVTYDGLINLKWLKIQSIPLGKLRGIRVHTQIKTCRYVYLYIYIQKNTKKYKKIQKIQKIQKNNN